MDLCYLENIKRNICLKQATVEEMKEKLNAVGPGFRLAKWTQLTLNLQNGTAHSCHAIGRSVSY